MRKLQSHVVLSAVMAALFLLSGQSYGAPLVFDYTAHVDSSDREGAPAGSAMNGRIVYDPQEIDRQVGASNYYPTSGTASITARGSEGFFLKQDTRVIVVTPGEVNDTMTLQTFVSESANDWHMVIDLIEPGGDDGWLQGDSSLPSEFPAMLQNAFMSLYFTDEGDWTRTVDATLLSITPATVPLPASAWLLGCALLALVGFKRQR